MKKRFLVTLLIICLTASMFTGCGSSAGPEESSESDDFIISIGDSGSEISANYTASVAFKEYVEANSNGRIVVNLYPNGQLGSDRELIEGVQLGQVAMMGTSTGQHVNFVPELGVFDAPFAFPDKESAYAFFEDENFKKALSDLYDQKGFHWMGMYVQGFRTLTANREVRTPDDCKNMDIRTMENKNQMAVWSALGANPTPLSFTELYTALQQGVVNAQENPIELIYAQKFYEQQQYLITTNHQVQAILFVMNRDFYNSLPGDLQAVVDEGMVRGIAAAREYTDINEEIYLQEMQDYGMEMIELTADQKQAFKDATTSVWDDIAAEFPDFYSVFSAALEATQ